MTIKTVILGATGYVSAELLRLIAGHLDFELCAAVSTSQHGNTIGSVFPHLQATYPEQTFCSMDDWASTLDSGDRLAVFSAAPHGASAILVKQALDIASDLEAARLLTYKAAELVEAGATEAVLAAAHAKKYGARMAQARQGRPSIRRAVHFFEIIMEPASVISPFH